MLADEFFKKKMSGFYVDVGCHQPLLNNNTYRLYKRGWRGINIDLDYNTRLRELRAITLSHYLLC